VENVDNYRQGFYLLVTTTVKVVNRSVDKTVYNSKACGVFSGSSQELSGCSYLLDSFE
jgi:hypothetical protein